jgi:hypothetical protein
MRKRDFFLQFVCNLIVFLLSNLLILWQNGFIFALRVWMLLTVDVTVKKTFAEQRFCSKIQKRRVAVRE